MYNNDYKHLLKQRRNALEILKQWDIELNTQNELELETNPSTVKPTYDESIVNKQ
ncbi:hypothetical protein [Sporosarcina highlanderae]|uniref:Fur-regulated basic protein B n=1 Tax=Sporosarcina highlanderae TaxID=3035916 RepID=A0ABT8JPW6_9BACL|nr:hypothetical protein [Sporosarcina highlanderae]MDN4607178.1 hypothetical protein [Sporosarcina highlanderae]